LNLRYKPYYWEFNIYETVDNSIILEHEICYRHPERIAEGRTCRVIDYIIIDSVAAMNQRKLDLIADTHIVKSTYEICYSTKTNSEDDICQPKGYIKILSWEKNKLILKEDVSFFDKEKNDTVQVVGTRVFKKDWFNL
jgi:hypothetical protein